MNRGLEVDSDSAANQILSKLVENNENEIVKLILNQSRIEDNIAQTKLNEDNVEDTTQSIIKALNLKGIY